MLRADVAVVGDGIAGLSCALACARRGLRTVVIGSRSRASASSASAGVLAPSVAPRPEHDPAQSFFRAALAAYPAWLDALAEETGRHVPLRLGVLELEAQSERGTRRAGEWSRSVSGAELAELEPSLRDHGRWSALLHERDGVVDVPLLLAALSDALERRGVRRIEAGARGIERGPDAVVVQTPSLAIAAPQLIVAAGAWSAALDGLPSRPAVTPLAGATALLAGVASPRHVVFGAGGYLVPRDRSVLVGATSRVAGFDARPSGADRRALARIVRRLIGEAALGDPCVGLRPMTSDGLPIIGPDLRDARVLHATGYGRNGILIAPLVGSCVAALALGEEPPQPIAAFGVGRFADGAPSG